ncbi:four helix bundle protein [Hymenobacter sp. ASUV-10]|uniref:Four helix bundle protein n=1 Tax=Hymenobacter aranciens TaxID=3063996 RepID=A0ABT9BDE6_9BACT|nr:four helix bundle protein [Hymenobacter sp. ASUV-10]MDO7874706.1 four helix bundle protein [Hymenobacter sp. ASUV-10]
MKESTIRRKSFDFASRIVKAYKFLVSEHREYVLSKQLLRSGTSIGANVEEAVAASSSADFIHRLSIAVREARETSYWLRLLYDNDFLSEASFASIHGHNQELIKILTSIILTTKHNQQDKQKQQEKQDKQNEKNS